MRGAQDTVVTKWRGGEGSVWLGVKKLVLRLEGKKSSLSWVPEGTSGLELSLIYPAGVATLAQGH